MISGGQELTDKIRKEALEVSTEEGGGLAPDIANSAISTLDKLGNAALEAALKEEEEEDGNVDEKATSITEIARNLEELQTKTALDTLGEKPPGSAAYELKTDDLEIRVKRETIDSLDAGCSNDFIRLTPGVGESLKSLTSENVLDCVSQKQQNSLTDIYSIDEDDYDDEIKRKVPTAWPLV
eukprot:TRINITY_DN5203_c0_g1_i1.p1 TRINITY_DN5203_c0_g1~~TRINITY_DN5203_c0_g1_i1.p1  ORF type:complete len:197 (+),score=50.51 TRINITY_DN5203_c0_g1_i1:47-592(+)